MCMFRNLNKRGNFLDGKTLSSAGKRKKIQDYMNYQKSLYINERRRRILQSQYNEQVRTNQLKSQVQKVENIIKNSNDNNVPWVESINKITTINKAELKKHDVKVGVVITTHGYYGVYARQCLECYIRELPKDRYIVLFINESNDNITLNLKKKYPNIEIIYNENQRATGGLTGTWNKGIEKCMENKCDVIVLSNDDILFDGSINNILWECYKNRNEMKYFGPCTNKPGPSSAVNNWIQYSLHPQDKINILNRKVDENLNGFLMVFSKEVLLKNKFNNVLYFDPSKPFAGNEVEWHNRFVRRGGHPVIIFQTFVYHYKNASWKKGHTLDDTCIYTINTGGYEAENILLDKSKYDTLYFCDNFKTLYKCINRNLIPFYVDTENKEAKLVQREIKTNVHNYLPYHYTRSVYVDGNVEIRDYNILEKYIVDKEYDIICFDHPERITVQSEINKIVQLRLETHENTQKIIEDFVKHNFKDNVGLTETNCLIRNHKNIIEFNNDWYNKIQICRRDQASFDFLLTKYKVNYKRYTYREKLQFTYKVSHQNPKGRTIL